MLTHSPRTDRLAVAAQQITGARTQQEDRLVVQQLADAGSERELLLVLCDGMGGEAGGALASAVVSEAFLTRMGQDTGLVEWRLMRALEDAGRRLTEEVKSAPHLAGMGSTVVAVAITAWRLSWLSVGDSPLWLLREGRLKRLNADHSMKAVLQRQVEEGIITREAAQRDATRNALLSVVCGSPPPMIDLAAEPCRLVARDQVLLASDGLLTLPEEEIAAVLLQTAELSPEESLQRLLSAVEQRRKPLQDNASAILVKIDSDQEFQGINIRLPENSVTGQGRKRKWWLPFSGKG